MEEEGAKVRAVANVRLKRTWEGAAIGARAHDVAPTMRTTQAPIKAQA